MKSNKANRKLYGAALKARPLGEILMCQNPGCDKGPEGRPATYYAPPSRVAKGSMYCSIVCAGVMRRVVRACPQCGEKKVRGSDTYCGSACYNRHRSLIRYARLEAVLNESTN